MKKASEIDITRVTSEEIGRCHKVFDLATGKAFYQVESRSQVNVEHQVRWSREHGFTCTCKAGQQGFRFCKDGVCAHVKWSLACAKEERDYLASLETSEPAAPVVKLTPVSEWTAAERRDWKLNESRNNAIDTLLADLEMARNPAKRYQTR